MGPHPCKNLINLPKFPGFPDSRFPAYSLLIRGIVQPKYMENMGIWGKELHSLHVECDLIGSFN